MITSMRLGADFGNIDVGSEMNPTNGHYLAIDTIFGNRLGHGKPVASVRCKSR